MVVKDPVDGLVLQDSLGPLDETEIQETGDRQDLVVVPELLVTRVQEAGAVPLVARVTLVPLDHVDLMEETDELEQLVSAFIIHNTLAL